MTIFAGSLRSALLAMLVLGTQPAYAQTPPKPTTPSDADVQELEQRFDSLKQQIDQLEASKDAARRQGLMQKNWQDMQDYMGWMHVRWGAGSPWMVGPGGIGPGATSCPMLGGSGAAWSVPEGTTPEQYSEQMLEHMQRMQELINQLAQTTDPQQRQRLLQEHWQTMYRDMESMRGLGWMWNGPMLSLGTDWSWDDERRPVPSAGAAKPLPDGGSAGAKLVSSYCTQCHAAPPPTLHTAQEWASVLGRMNLQIDGGAAGIRAPSVEEMQTILAYMHKHAR